MKISLEQWRTLIAVVEAGGYAQAAEALHKTQSTLTYAVQKLESLLGVKAFEIHGRKAVLTPTGQVLYRRAKALVEEAERLERGAAELAAGWEPQLRLAVDIIFPTWLLLECFQRFADERPQTRLELYETVLGGTDEALLSAQVDLAITTHVPAGFVGDALMNVRFIPVAHPDHPLHALGRELSMQDLRKHRQLVIRDSAIERKRDAGEWLGSEQRWTVSHKATSIAAAVAGLGIAWYPEYMIWDELQHGVLKELPLREGRERFTQLYLVFADADYAGPGARRLEQVLREGVAKACTRATGRKSAHDVGAERIRRTSRRSEGRRKGR